MNKTDKSKIAESFRGFQAGAAQCANLCYNLAQSDDIPERHRKSMSESVRAHDAARNHLITTLQRFGILPETQRTSAASGDSVATPEQSGV